MSKFDLREILLLVYIFFASMSFHSPYLVIGKLTLFDILLICYLLFTLTFNGQKLLKQFLIYKPIFQLTLIFTLILFISMVVNSLRGISNPARAISIVRYPLFVTLMIVIVDYVGYSTKKLILASFAYIAGLCLVYYHEWISALYITKDFFDAAIPIVGKSSMINKNNIAAIGGLSLPVFLSLFYVLKEKAHYKKIYFLIIPIFIYISITILFTHSKTGWIPLFLVLSVLFFISSLKNKMVMAGIFLLGYWLIEKDKIFLWIDVILGKIKSESSWESRIFLKQQALDAFTAHPILGIGWGSFDEFLNVADNPHDINMQILAEGGILAFVAYFSVLFIIWHYMFRKIHIFSKEAIVPMLFIAIYMIISTASGIPFTFHSSWVVFGLILSYCNIIRKKKEYVEVQISG